MSEFLDARLSHNEMRAVEAMRRSHHDIRYRTEHDIFATLAPFGAKGKLWVGSLCALIVAGAAAWIVQLTYGLRVTGLREYVSWGTYMTNFVFFIGVSHAGTLISAILRVTNAEWRRPITRMAEAITVFALMVGAPMVIIDMGRPDRLLNVFLHGRLQSPILWDVCSIMTYLSGSLLYLYVAMIPDLALLRDRKIVGGWRGRLHAFLALGYRDTPEQRRFLNRGLATMAIIIIPVAISVHTVVSWVFSMTLRPGWHSTIFGPYFVIGAIFSGTAGIITAMAIFRRVYHLQPYLTHAQFRNLGTLLLVLNLLYVYFTLAEYVTAWYGAEESEARLINVLMREGPYSIAFWAWVIVGLFVPLVLLAIRTKQSIAPIVIASVIVNVGMWLKRYLIIVPTMLTPYIPPEAAGQQPVYFPTLVEWTITAGAVAFFLLLFTLFSKVIPIVSVWETVEGVEEVGAERVGLNFPVLARGRGPATVVILAVVITAMAPTLHAQTTSATAPVSVEITRAVEEGKTVILATVTSAGAPVEGAQLQFFVKRTFGRIKLGEDETLDDGTAITHFPEGLSGDKEARIEVIVDVNGLHRARALLPGGSVLKQPIQPFPRALWSSRAPLPLIMTILILLSGVWLTYATVVYQLVKMKGSPTQ